MSETHPPWLMSMEKAEALLLRKSFKERKEEYDLLLKDIFKAKGIVQEAITRYTKQKLRLRSKKAAEDPFAELADYRSIEDIQEAYGFELITDVQRRRLIDLWEAREQSLSTKQTYEDRVTQMLRRALYGIGEEFRDSLDEFENLQDSLEAERRKNDPKAN